MAPITTNVDEKALKSTKFPPEFERKIDTDKIMVPVIKSWASGEISRILGFEDDVVIGLLFDILDSNKNPNIKSLQVQLGGFLGAEAPKFCKELWNLCLSAQDSPNGVPPVLLEAKKAELMQERQEQERAAEHARQRREQQEARDRDLDDLRYRDRRDRDDRRSFRGGRNFDRGRGPRGYLSRSRSRSRSPPRRRPAYDQGYSRGPPSRNLDSHAPGSSGQFKRPRSPMRSDRRRASSRDRSPSDARGSSPDRRNTRPGGYRGRRGTSPRRGGSGSARRYNDRFSISRSRSPIGRRSSPRSPRRGYSQSRSPSPRRYDGRSRNRRPGRRTPSLSPERVSRPPANKSRDRLSRSPPRRRTRSPSPRRPMKPSGKSASPVAARRSTPPKDQNRGFTPPSAASNKVRRSDSSPRA